MLIVTQTTISFKVPEENDAVKQFIRSHDMKEWSASGTADYICYTRSESLYCVNQSTSVEENVGDVEEQTEKEAACY